MFSSLRIFFMSDLEFLVESCGEKKLANNTKNFFFLSQLSCFGLFLDVKK